MYHGLWRFCIYWLSGRSRIQWSFWSKWFLQMSRWIRSIWILSFHRCSATWSSPIYHRNTILRSSQLSYLFWIISQHSMSLSRPCLTIHEDCPINAFNWRVNDRFDSFLINIFISNLLIKTFIKQKLFISRD